MSESFLSIRRESLLCSHSSTDCLPLESNGSSSMWWGELHEIGHLTSSGLSLISTASCEDKKVVVKTLKSELEHDHVFVNALEKEFQILSMIDHLNIVKHIGTEFYGDGKRFIVIE